MSNFCSVPFTQLFLYPTGEVFVCCENSYKVGDIKQQSIEEIWNSKEIQALRKEFIDDDVVTCKSFIEEQGCNKAYTHLEKFVDKKEILDQSVVAFDVMLNGKCNLQCIMCDVFKMPNGVYDEAGFWEGCRENIFPHLKHISLKSGEPFIQKDTFRLIDEVTRVNPECEWSFTTNGHYNFKSIEKKLENLNIREFDISIDSLVPETFSKIRKGGELAKVIKTTDEIISMRNRIRALGKKSFQIKISTVIQQDNWNEMESFLKFAKNRKIIESFIFLYKPSELSLLESTKELREEVVAECFRLIEKYPLMYKVISVCLNPLINSLDKKRYLLDLKVGYHNYLKTIRTFTSVELRRDHICGRAMSQLFIQPDGKMTPCCWLNDYHFGHITTHSMKEGWNSENAVKLRNEFQNGQVPEVCRSSIEKHSCNIEDTELLVGDYGTMPRKMDVMLNGDCNLDCIMCNIDQEINGVFTDDTFWSEAKEKFIPHLEYIDIKGGEPFIQKDIYRLIDTVSEINPSILWNITTNGHYNFTNKIAQYLDKMQINSFTVSIDSLDNENFKKIRPVYQRYQTEKNSESDLELVKKYLDSLIEYSFHARDVDNSFAVTVNMCIQKLNYHEVENFICFSLEKNINLFFIFIEDPKRESLLDFNREKREQILKSFIFVAKKYQTKVLLGAIVSLFNSLENSDMNSFKEDIEEIAKYEIY